MTGRVQGVFFRISTKKEADRLNISGWVRNTANGHVEGLASGDEETLQDFCDWLRQGPQLARVDELEIITCALEAHANFQIR